MIFTIPRTNVIECDEGYSVEMLGSTGLRYMEKGLVLFVDSEILAGPSGVLVYSESIKADTPISAEERIRIIENIRAAFHFRGFEIQVA